MSVAAAQAPGPRVLMDGGHAGQANLARGLQDQSLEGEAESQPSGSNGDRTEDKHLKNRAVTAAQVPRNLAQVLVLV